MRNPNRPQLRHATSARLPSSSQRRRQTLQMANPTVRRSWDSSDVTRDLNAVYRTSHRLE